MKRWRGLAQVIELTDGRGRVHCGAATKAGDRCRGFATWGTVPPRCSAHGGKVGGSRGVEVPGAVIALQLMSSHEPHVLFGGKVHGMTVEFAFQREHSAAIKQILNQALADLEGLVKQEVGDEGGEWEVGMPYRGEGEGDAAG